MEQTTSIKKNPTFVKKNKKMNIQVSVYIEIEFERNLI